MRLNELFSDSITIDSMQQILIVIMVLIHEETSYYKDRNRKRVYSSIRVVIRKKKN